MHGTGTPLVTPFDEDGAVDEAALRDLTDWVSESLDFVVPCGSNSEAAMLGPDERARVVEVVAEETDLPVLAGTGHPGYRETLRATERAADAGADAALVVTPFYHRHDQETLAAYYRDLADESPLPVYLYSVPQYTGVALEPETVATLATHDNVHGIKDSSGSVGTLQRTVARTPGDRETPEPGRTRSDRTPEEFSVLVGAGGVYAAGLDAGADGGVLALANAVPELASEVYDRHAAGEDAAARELNADLAELNHAVTARHGVPGLKAAMRARGKPAGRVRRPLRPVDDAVERELGAMVDALGEA